MSNLKEFQKLVIANASHVKGLVVGDKAPDFSLPNAIGKHISLSKMLESGIVIIKFYRGEWCPICNLDLREIQKHIQEIKSYNTTVIAISPQKPDDALTAVEKNELEFEVLSDLNQDVIKAYNLQFNPGENYLKRRDLSLVNADGSNNLPIPATFIINTNQIIEAAHVDPNYTERMPIKNLLDTLKRIS